jgi:sn-glycerol 3-phosphate transport system ATP-binding protein
MSEARSVEYSNVSKRFHAGRVLDGISLRINPGEFVVFVGPSGSGKSTLLRILAGLESTDTGAVLIGDEDVTHNAPKDRNVAMVFQNYALYPHMSVEENITFGMRIRKEPAPARGAALRRVTEMLRLHGLLDRKPRQLSGGQRQRVAMARAIVRNPSVFLMDEPLSNLDAKLRNEVRASIIELQHALGVTTIYVTHDQVEAMTMADRLVVLDQGRIQQVGSPEEVYRQPANIFVAGFMGTPSINFLAARCQGNGLRLRGGVEVSLRGRRPALPEAASDLKSGAVLLGLRPSAIRLRPAAPPAGDDAPEIRIPVTVTGREMLGAHYLMHARDQEGSDIQALIPSDLAAPGTGEPALACFSFEALHFFCPETCRRIA